MAQNIQIAGATYPDVPAVDLPIAGGGTQRFVDTSDADAAASDITQGKYAYVNGQKIEGTGSGGDVYRVATGTFTGASGNDGRSWSHTTGFSSIAGYVVYMTAYTQRYRNIICYGDISSGLNDPKGAAVAATDKSNGVNLSLSNDGSATVVIYPTISGGTLTLAFDSSHNSQYGFRGTYNYVIWGR